MDGSEIMNEYSKIVWLNPEKEKEFNQKSDKEKEEYGDVLASLLTDRMSSQTREIFKEK